MDPSLHPDPLPGRWSIRGRRHGAALWSAYDALIGPDRWAKRRGVGGTVPVRFPSEEYPGAVGWHIEGSYEVNGGVLGQRALAYPRPARAVPVQRCGRGRRADPDGDRSHLAIPSILEPGRRDRDSSDASISRVRPSVMCRTVVHATGRAGDVFLCHPFIVHTATWPHRGTTTPQMMAQPGIYVEDGSAIDGSDPSPVARAIVAGLDTGGV